MGQQQLLLLVLGIVIVGLAVVVGIQAFSENQQKANLDALVNDGVRLASDLQAWSLKPAAFGGPPADAEDAWTLATFDNLGYATNADGEYETSSGTFTLSGGVFSAVGTDSENTATITVTGVTPDDVETTTSSASATSGG